MDALPDALQSILENWYTEVFQEIDKQRRGKEQPQYDQKLGLWCGCQGYNPYYSCPLKKSLADIPSQWVQPLLNALQQTLEGDRIVPIRLEIGKGGFALRAVRMDVLTASSEPEHSPPVLDALFALFL